MTNVAVERYFAGHFNLEMTDNSFDRIEVSVFSPKKSMYLGHLGEFQSSEIRWSIRKEYPDRKLSGRMQLKFSDGFLKMLHDCRQFGSFRVYFYLDGEMAAERVIPSYSFVQTLEVPDISRPAGVISFIGINGIKSPGTAESGAGAGGADGAGGSSAGFHERGADADALSKAFSSAMSRSGPAGDDSLSSGSFAASGDGLVADHDCNNACSADERVIIDDSGALKTNTGTNSGEGDTGSGPEASSGAFGQRRNNASGVSSGRTGFSHDPRLDSRPFDKNWEAPGVLMLAVYMLLVAALLVFSMFLILK